MTPDFIGIVAVGATVIGLPHRYRRDALADAQASRAEARVAAADSRKDVEALAERLCWIEVDGEAILGGRGRHNKPTWPTNALSANAGTRSTNAWTCIGIRCWVTLT